VMNQGRIEQLGAPEELYELPRTAFVATFLGQSNLFPGTIASSSDRSIVVTVAGDRRVEVPRSRSQKLSGQVVVGIRPEKLQLHPAEPEPTAGRNVLGPGRITDVSFSGVSTSYSVAMPGAGTVTVFAQNVVSGPVVHEGAEVWVSWLTDHGFGLPDAAVPVPQEV
jgi:spermidine/putrescine transport system ATP-binding protein